MTYAMAKPSRRRVSLSVLLSALLTCTLTACTLFQDRDYRVPQELWTVQISPPIDTFVEPILLVQISDVFEWPDPPPGANESIHYRVNVKRPGDEKPVKNVGRLTKDERFNVVALIPQHLRLVMTRRAYEERLASHRVEFQKILHDVRQLTGPPSVELRERIELEITLDEADINLTERKQVFKYQITLDPFTNDGVSLNQELLPKTPRSDKYEWGVQVADADDPCSGKTPEQCAVEKIQMFKDRLCEVTNDDGSPRFQDECARLEELLATVPPRVKVLCTLENGSIAGRFVTREDVIEINGDFYLTSDCADAVLLHELSHANDDHTETVRFHALRRSAKEFQDILENTQNAIAFEAIKVLLRNTLIAIDQTRTNAFTERVNTECKAYFASIDAGDMFGYPGEGNAWMKTTVKDLIAAQVGIRAFFKQPMKNEPQCSCFQRLNTWLHAEPQDPILRNLDTDLADNEFNWGQYLRRLTDRACE